MIQTSKRLVTLLLVLSILSPSAAFACGPCTNCAQWQMEVTQAINQHKQWWANTYWQQNYLPALKNFTTAVVSTLMLQARMIGGFMDAQNHLNSQRVLQELAANTAKSYIPSDAMCQFGTLTKSLAASQALAERNQLVLAERSSSRQLGKHFTSAASGVAEDKLARLRQFQERFCDPQDNNNGMKRLCDTGGPDTRHNLDIDYVRTVDIRPTLNINFTDTAISEDERDVIALANNLYSHEVFRRFNDQQLQRESTGGKDNQSTYMQLRALTAKRNAAENSFNTLIGMKSAGTDASRAYIRTVLQNVGMSAANIDRFMASGGGANVNPSYMAQMEILNKKLYQDPRFYAELMDGPANVQRQYAAMQSFGLMQQRDLFETIIRSEMLLSLILEMEVAKHQDDIQNRLNTTLGE